MNKKTKTLITHDNSLFRSRFAVTSFVGVIFASITLVYGSPGNLMTDFHEVLGDVQRVSALLVLPEGGMVVGLARQGTNALVKINAGGSQIQWRLTVNGGEVTCLASAADGRLYVGGSYSGLGGVLRNRVARLLTDGAVDAGFAPMGLGDDSDVVSLAVEKDGALLVGGNISEFDGVPVKNLLRMNSEGILDTAFAGHFLSAFPTSSSTVSQIEPLPDGRIYLTWGRPIRLNSDGTLDSTFNVSAISFPAKSFKVLSDGKLLWAQNNLEPDPIGCTGRLWRLLSDGSVDPAFPGNIVMNGIITTLALQADDKILVGGDFDEVNGHFLPGLARFGQEGVIDNGFRCDFTWNGGQEAASDQLIVEGAVPEPDGSVLIRGWGFEIAGQKVNPVIRLEGGDQPPGPPQVSVIPSSVEFTEGHVARICARVRSVGNPSLVWHRDGNLVPGQTTEVFKRRNVQMNDAGQVQVRVTDEYGTVTSPAVQLKVTAGPTWPGSVDITFDAGTNGSPNDSVQALARDSSGRIYAGRYLTRASEPITPALCRMLSDGQLDGSYEPLRDASLPLAAVTSLAMQPDGKLLAACGFGQRTPPTITRIVRLLESGQLDPLFDPTQTEGGRSFALQADGKIVVSGVKPSGTECTRLWRVQPNGMLDASFQPFSHNTINTYGLAVQPDGKIVVIQATPMDPGRCWLGRFNSDGSPDSSFVYPAELRLAITSLIVQPSGKIVVTSGNIPSSPGPGGLWRINPDGSLNNSFQTSPLTRAAAGILAVQPDGKMIVSVYGSGLSADSRLASIVRFWPDGQIDESFKLVPASSSSGPYLSGLVEPDGQVMVAGTFSEKEATERQGLMRLNGNPQGTLLEPRHVSDSFCMSVRTLWGRTYRIDASADLAGNAWQQVKILSGDNTRQTITLPQSEQRSEFFRCRVSE